MRTESRRIRQGVDFVTAQSSRRASDLQRSARELALAANRKTAPRQSDGFVQTALKTPVNLHVRVQASAAMVVANQAAGFFEGTATLLTGSASIAALGSELAANPAARTQLVESAKEIARDPLKAGTDLLESQRQQIQEKGAQRYIAQFGPEAVLSAFTGNAVRVGGVARLGNKVLQSGAKDSASAAKAAKPNAVPNRPAASKPSAPRPLPETRVYGSSDAEFGEFNRADPVAIQKRIDEIRNSLPTKQRIALDRELQGRRFVDQGYYEPAVRSGDVHPEARFGAADFAAWKRAERLIIHAAEKGEPLTVELLSRVHLKAAAKNTSVGAVPGSLRKDSSVPADVFFGGLRQAVSPRELDVLRANPEIRVTVLGPVEGGPAGHSWVHFNYLNPERVEGRLNEVLNQLEAQLRTPGVDPVAAAADAQRVIVSIHPFQDGNGRTSRLVMDYVLARTGAARPIVRNPNLDIVRDPWTWREEVRRGMSTTLAVAERAWLTSKEGR